MLCSMVYIVFTLETILYFRNTPSLLMVYIYMCDICLSLSFFSSSMFITACSYIFFWWFVDLPLSPLQCLVDCFSFPMFIYEWMLKLYGNITICLFYQLTYFLAPCYTVIFTSYIYIYICILLFNFRVNINTSHSLFSNWLSKCVCVCV